MDVVAETGEWKQGSEWMLCLKQGSEWMCVKQVNRNRAVNGCCV